MRKNPQIDQITLNHLFPERIGHVSWIGVHKNFGDWQMDGFAKGAILASDWLVGQPDLEIEKCVETHVWGRWNNVLCNAFRPYTCERRIG